jgi:germination protein M
VQRRSSTRNDIRTEGTPVLRSIRPFNLLCGIAAVALAVAACSPAPAPTAAPTTSASTSAPSDAAPPSDQSSSAPPSTPAASPTAPPETASPTAPPSGSPGASAAPSPAGTTLIRAYFFLGSFTGNAGLAPVLRAVPQTTSVATAAMAALLAGPNAKELAASPAMYTTVPTGTRFLGVSVASGVATVNLSSEFASGSGSASVLGRLAQVVYTLTQFPTVHSVLFELDGRPVTTFSSEGVVLDHAVSRADYVAQLPGIFVDRPAWGAAVGNPGTVSGLANVFEAQFQVQLLDAGGGILVARTVAASCGTGCWGTFAVTVPYTVANAQWGTLRVFDPSPKDGSPENVTRYPLWLAPAG